MVSGQAIGVSQNQRLRMTVMAGATSRRNGFSAARSHAKTSANANAATRIGTSKMTCTADAAANCTSGSVSVGNTMLLTRCALREIAEMLFVTDSENKSHGTRPATNHSAKG